MRFFYRLDPEGSAWVAECEELEAFGKGPTPSAALEQLRAVISDHIDRPNAVAPPEEAEPINIELVPLDEAFRASLLDDAETSPAR